MKRLIAIALVLGALVGVAGQVHAAAIDLPKIMLHALAPTTKSPCTRVQNVPTAGCDGYTAGIDNQALYPTLRYMYLLIVNGPAAAGLAGLQCGISHSAPSTISDGVGFDVYSWALCATLEFQTPGVPWGGHNSGNLITWDASTRCQTSPGVAPLNIVAVAGYFYCAAYSPVVVNVIPRPVDNAAKVATCASIEIPVLVDTDPAKTHLGSVGFDLLGVNPCGRDIIVPVATTTWSGVKNLLN